MFSILLPYIINGLCMGLLLALVALGFNVIVGVMELINLSHGALFALGAYFALFIINPLETFVFYQQLEPLTRYIIALILAPIGVALFGMLLEILMRRTYGKDPIYGLLLTWGTALMIEESIRTIWGPQEAYFPTPKEITGAFLFDGIIYSKYQIYATIFTCLVITLLWYFIERTKYGAIIKAGAHDSEMITAMGVNLKMLRLFVFALGTLLAAIAGIIMAPLWGMRPHMGMDAVIPAFLIVVLGGIGSFWGTVVAGLIVGLLIAITGYFFEAWSVLSMYLLTIVVLTFRTRGLLGKVSAFDK